LIEPFTPKTSFPAAWVPAETEPLAHYPALQRAVVGGLFGAIYLLGCPFGCMDLLSTSPAVPVITMATLVKALLSGLLGARMVRMGISIPVQLIWSFFSGGIERIKDRAKSTASSDEAKPLGLAPPKKQVKQIQQVPKTHRPVRPAQRTRTASSRKGPPAPAAVA
jgi:hypothetical protein